MILLVKADRRPERCGECIGWNKCDGWNKEPYTCPIIGELPETYGRLIDADVLKETLMKSAYPEQREWYFAEACQFIDEAPTIVEAST